jgi:hypothetical protein
MSPRLAKPSPERAKDRSPDRLEPRRYPVQVRATFVRLARRPGSAAAA